MDHRHPRLSRDPIVITGIGLEASDSLPLSLVQQNSEEMNYNLSHDCRPLEFLKQKKTLKFSHPVYELLRDMYQVAL